jgi:hypothetical protein
VEATGVATVFLFALLTAVATGLGALPFAFAKHPTRGWLGASSDLVAVVVTVSVIAMVAFQVLIR